MNKPKGQRWLYKSPTEHFIVESLGESHRAKVVQVFPDDLYHNLGEIVEPSWGSNSNWMYLDGQDAPQRDY